MTARDHGNVGRALEMRPATIVDLLTRNDAFRKPQRFVDMLRASECECFGRSGLETINFPQTAFLEGALHAAQQVNGGDIARHYADRPQQIQEAIREARISAVQQFKNR